jgi:hypothetical protein
MRDGKRTEATAEAFFFILHPSSFIPHPSSLSFVLLADAALR